MVDQIQTATRQRTDTGTETRAGERSSAIATLQTAERYDHIRIAPLDVSLRVLHQIGDFGVEGVRATSNDTTYLLVAESDPELPDVRIERWNGSTFRPVLRTSRCASMATETSACSACRRESALIATAGRVVGGGRASYGRRAVGRDDGADSHGR